MSDRTEVFVPKFFLVGSKKIIEITRKLTLGRTQADVLLKDTKLSSTHCEVFPSGVSLMIKDLQSTNGIFINGVKVSGSEPQRLQLGDIVRLGSEDYVLQDQSRKMTLETVQSSAFSWKDILSCFEASSAWKITYLLTLAIAFYCRSLDYEFTVTDENLLFLNELLPSFSIILLIKCLILSSAILLSHGYFVRAYLKKSVFFKVVCFIPVFFLATIVSALIFSEKNKLVEGYMFTRNNISELDKLKESGKEKYLRFYRESHDKILLLLSVDNQEKLDRDYEQIMKANKLAK